MRYAIFFTPPAGNPLTQVAANWLGRSAFSGEALDTPEVSGLGMHEIAFHTALPRRYGFHGTLKAPFRMADDIPEVTLLRHLMRFAGTLEPFEIPRLEISRLGDYYGLAPAQPCEAVNYLAACIVQEFDHFRAPLSEAEIERRDPDGLTAPQFANLHRWGNPYVMDEFRFYMTLTGPIRGHDIPRFDRALTDFFAPVLDQPVDISHLTLFVEDEPGAPFRVHSMHPLGRIAARRSA